MKLIPNDDPMFTGVGDVQLYNANYKNAGDSTPGTLNIEIRNVKTGKFISEQRVAFEQGIEFFIDERSKKPRRRRSTYFIISLDDWKQIGRMLRQKRNG